MKDLEFLVKCTPEELEVLADLLREKGGPTSDLEQSSTFSSKADYATHSGFVRITARYSRMFAIS